MKRPAIFFDRDNTLIRNDGYLGDPSEVELMAGAAGAVARARDMGFAVVTFSNQSGVARGLFSEDAVIAVNHKLEELLLEEHPRAKIDRHEFCPYHPEALVPEYRQESELRKPRPGMLLRAASELELDLGASWVVGDAPRDIEAGKAAGCRTILVKTPGLPASPAASEPSTIEPDEITSSLEEAMDIIEAGGEELSTHVSAQTNPSSPVGPDFTRLEQLAQQILDQLRRRNDHPPDFSLGKMLAGVTQVLAIAVAIGGYFFKTTGESPIAFLLVAIFLQLLTISLLMMGREK
jgi:D-glycero-D-manno-heptose 1,7-bisphosphate phosphatase